MNFTLHIQNLRALQHFSWSPEPLSILIGANGVGKSTALLVLKLLRAAYDHELPGAVTRILGGSRNLRSWGASEDDPIEIGVDIENIQWRLRLIPRGPTVDYLADEWLSHNGTIIFRRDSLGNFTHGTDKLQSDARLGLRTLADAQRDNDEASRRMILFMNNLTVFHDPDIYTLRTQGSRTTDDRHLHSRGSNALTLLRRWSQERPLRHRYQFVLQGLKAAFPGLIEDLDFQEAGQTLVARFYRPSREMPNPLENEANGVLQMLVLLCDLASAEPGGVIAIDEPENSLHPYAIRCFLRDAASWAKKHQLTVLMSTHSTVLLDELQSEQIFVMRPGTDGQLPVRLDRFRDARWLASFKLGDLYEQGELGSNDDQV